MKKIEKIIKKIAQDVSNLGKSLVGPSTLYAFGVIIFGELNRVSNLQQITTPHTADKILQIGSSASWFALLLFFISMIWMASNLSDFFIPKYIRALEEKEKNNILYIIKTIILIALSFYILYALYWLILGTYLIVFIR